MPRDGDVDDDGAAPTWTYIFVLCSLCGRFISEEDRHTCPVSIADRHERAAMRAWKVNALTQQRGRR